MHDFILFRHTAYSYYVILYVMRQIFSTHIHIRRAYHARYAPPIDGFLRTGKRIMSGLHLDKHHTVVMESHNVDFQAL